MEFQDFSVIQILREINFGGSKFKKSRFAIFEALHSVDLINFSLLDANINTKLKFRAIKYVKMADFSLLESQI